VAHLACNDGMRKVTYRSCQLHDTGCRACCTACRAMYWQAQWLSLSPALRADAQPHLAGNATLLNMALPEGCAGHIPTRSTDSNNQLRSQLSYDNQTAELVTAADELCKGWKDVVQGLVRSGLTQNDALAALILADGDQEQAEVEAVEYAEQGGAAKVIACVCSSVMCFLPYILSLRRTPAAACVLCCGDTVLVSCQAYLEMVDEAVEADAQKTRQAEAKVAAEVDKVLKMLELHNGVS
jgi:hypothetical protein